MTKFSISLNEYAKIAFLIENEKLKVENYFFQLKIVSLQIR